MSKGRPLGSSSHGEKPLPMEKICPNCGADNAANATFCVNEKCNHPLGGIVPHMKQRQKDEQGSGGARGLNQKVIIPQNTVIANNLNINQPINNVEQISYPTHDDVMSVKNKKHRFISDEDVELVDDNHLDNVQESADELGLF